MYVCWSVKGGSGTTVVAAALSLLLCRTNPTLLVDLCGDAPGALGMPEPAGPGVVDWLASPTSGADALHRLAVPARDGLEVVPCGSRSTPVPPTRWWSLGEALQQPGRTVVVDAGVGAPHAALLPAGAHSLLVVRPCYLAIRRAVAAEARPTGIVLVTEPGRALGARDVERAVSAPVVAEVPYDPSVARAVDAGLLAVRLPGSIARPLRGAA
jgi:MinD superfamily P-loop ATPase